MQRSFETERLYLRIIDENEAKLVHEYFLRNRKFLEEWDPKKEDNFFTLVNHMTQIEQDLVAYKVGSALRLWVFKKNDESKIIGTLGFNNIVKGAFLSCHLGYRSDKDEVNKGYVTEALKKGIDIIFNEYKLHRIEANIMPKNKASLRVVEKLGFYNEGLAKNYLKINDKWEDHIHMVLLNENLE